MLSSMARPKKPRYFDGAQLVDNLYPDSRRKAGRWRYLRPDGTWKHFTADTPEEANRLATEANVNRHLYRSPPSPADRDLLAYQIPLYIAHREQEDAKLLTKQSWQNRRYALQAFAQDFDVPISEIDRSIIATWWQTLTYHKKKLRHAEFRRLFNWLMSEGLWQGPYNPFTTSDDRARLYVTGEPPRQRARMTREVFWSIYAEAVPALQIAMGISLTTFMRESDICSLRFDRHLEGGLLRKVIGKSEQKLGSARAARLQWDVGNHRLLKSLLDRARELSMQHYRCPYVISHLPKQRRVGKTKDHPCQVTPRRLIELFAEARDRAGHGVAPAGKTPVTFHEIRSLADKLATDAGYNLSVIREAMAHEDESTTRLYLEDHQLPHHEVGVVLTPDVIGGEF